MFRLLSRCAFSRCKNLSSVSWMARRAVSSETRNSCEGALSGCLQVAGLSIVADSSDDGLLGIIILFLFAPVSLVVVAVALLVLLALLYIFEKCVLYVVHWTLLCSTDGISVRVCLGAIIKESTYIEVLLVVEIRISNSFESNGESKRDVRSNVKR